MNPRPDTLDRLVTALAGDGAIPDGETFELVTALVRLSHPGAPYRALARALPLVRAA